MNATRRRGLPALLIASLSLVIATAGCTSSGGLGTVPPAPTTPPPSTPALAPDITPGPTTSPTNGPTTRPTGSPSPTPGTTPIETVVVRAYYVLDGGVRVEGLVPTLREVPTTVAVARAAMGVLLDGANLQGASTRLSSAIPAGTRLLGLNIRDGIATVDLSREFESGGGSASALLRLGQVVYTLTQFSTVGAVTFQVEGRTVTTFGSEGILLDRPQARADFEDLLPWVFVDRPAFGAAIGNPARITGNANVFEATFQWAILDGAGRIVAEDFATATCGTGCRGTFDITARYSVPTAQWGTLRVYVNSARDGQPEGIRDYPVWLTPAS